MTWFLQFGPLTLGGPYVLSSVFSEWLIKSYARSPVANTSTNTCLFSWVLGFSHFWILVVFPCCPTCYITHLNSIVKPMSKVWQSNGKNMMRKSIGIVSKYLSTRYLFIKKNRSVTLQR